MISVCMATHNGERFLRRALLEPPVAVPEHDPLQPPVPGDELEQLVDEGKYATKQEVKLRLEVVHARIDPLFRRDPLGGRAGNAS